MIIKTNKENYCIQNILSLFVPEKYEKKFDSELKNKKNFENRPQDYTIKEISEFEIEKNMSNLRVLTLGVTQECNFRCKYCAYGGYYKRKRIHSHLKMHIDTYKKAIDLFFNHVYSPSRTTRHPIIIAFYGGETLLEFENIVAATKYAHDINVSRGNLFPIIFSLNTNGLLLTEDVVKTLEELQIRVDLSFDGPKTEHNKFRVKKDGSGSFDDVFSNIEKIKDKFPDYYEKWIRICITIHPFHNLKEIENFLYSRKDLFSGENVLSHWINMNSLKSGIEKKWLDANVLQKKQLANDLDKDKWFYQNIINSYFDALFNIPTQNLVTKTQFTGNCIPGEHKVFVDVNGGLHICERILHTYPIGHVSAGFDLGKIKRMILAWNREIEKNHCHECDVWWICKKCYANSTTAEGIRIQKDYCQDSIKRTKDYSYQLLKLLEATDEAENNRKFSNLISYIDAL